MTVSADVATWEGTTAIPAPTLVKLKPFGLIVGFSGYIVPGTDAPLPDGFAPTVGGIRFSASNGSFGQSGEITTSADTWADIFSHGHHQNIAIYM